MRLQTVESEADRYEEVRPMDIRIGPDQPSAVRFETLEPSHLWVLGVVARDTDRRPATGRVIRPDTPECECPDFCLLDHDNE